MNKPPAFQRYTEVDAPPPDRANWLVSRKLNGVAACYYDGKLWSRSLKEFPSHRFVSIISTLRQIPGACIYGELWNHQLPLPSIAGQCNHYSNELGQANVKFYMYDCYDVHNPYSTFVQRTADLQWIISDCVFDLTRLDLNEDKVDYSNDSIDGVIYRRKNGIFVPGQRTGGTLKRKFWRELEADVIDVVPGERELRGTMGALRCKYNNVEFSVGSGFDLADRHRYNKCRPNKIKVKFMNFSDSGCPLNPTFMEDLD